jgi:hypothetical protein
MGKPVWLQVKVRHGLGMGCWCDTHGFTRAIAYMAAWNSTQVEEVPIFYFVNMLTNDVELLTWDYA